MATETISTTPKHTGQTFLYGASLIWHKLSYYGWRSILFLLLYDESSSTDLEDYGYLIFWISIGLSVSFLAGGLVGDLLIGNKKTSFIGAVLMFIGSILFFFKPSMQPLLPLIVFVIGSGLYQSNLKALYAKLYLHETRLLDSAFILWNLFINLGSFFGAFLVALIGESYGVEYGFLAVGISTLLSISMLLLTKKRTEVSSESNSSDQRVLNKQHVKPVRLLLGIFAIYCLFWHLSYYDIYSMYWNIEIGSYYFIPYFWADTLSFLFYMIIGIYLVILWSKKHSGHFTKLTSSTIIVFVSFVLAFAFYREGSVATSIITLITIFTYTIGELLVEPLINSSIAKLVNRKYLAIAYGTVGLLTMASGYLFLYTQKGIQLVLEDSIYVGFVGLFLLGVFLLLRKRKLNEQ